MNTDKAREALIEIRDLARNKPTLEARHYWHQAQAIALAALRTPEPVAVAWEACHGDGCELFYARDDAQFEADKYEDGDVRGLTYTTTPEPDPTPTDTDKPVVTEAMVRSLVDWVCDDFLPSYGISGEEGRNDVELPEAVRIALAAALAVKT